MEGLLEVSQLEMWTAGVFVRGRARRLWSPVQTISFDGTHSFTGLD
jgi:hypothetical protein